jgi:hypothetical protein
MHLIFCFIFFSLLKKEFDKILDKADNVEPNYTDGSTCIQEAENETCEVQ